MTHLDYLKESLKDFQKFNTFNWHPQTDVRIAQELYMTYVSFLGSSLLREEKHSFMAKCKNADKSGVMQNDRMDKLWVYQVRGEFLPETLEEILARTAIYQDVLEQMVNEF